MRIFTGIFLTLLLSTPAWTSRAVAQQPQLYEASYLAKAAGMSATAERKLERLNGSRYRLSQAMEVKVLGARLGEISEISEFDFSNGELTPELYSYRQSGIARKKERVDFDWQAGIATSIEDDEQWQLLLTAGAVDKLSFQLLLRTSIPKTPGSELEVQMVDGDEIETHLYRVLGEEKVTTAMGTVDCLKIARIRDPGSNRRTTFWLARDWNFLLVKFEQTRGSSTETELLLESAAFDGQVVTPLP